MPGDAGQHPRTNLIPIVKSEYEIGPAISGENFMRAGLSLDLPA
jgi:hypothetical protein